MPAAEVIASYHDLWHVEAPLRMSKSDLAARPMCARTRDAIEALLIATFPPALNTEFNAILDALKA